MASDRKKSEYEQVKDFILLCLRHWYYFVISMLISGGIGIFYYLTQKPVFMIMSQVSVRNNESLLGSSISSSKSSLLSSFGFGGGSSDNIEDEALKMASQGYVRNLIKDLNLNTSYTQTKFLGFNKTPLYDRSPLVLSVDAAVSDTIPHGLPFTFKIKPEETTVKLKLGFKTIVDEKIKSFPAVINTPFGKFTLSKSAYFDNYDYPMTVDAFYGGNDFWAQVYRAGITVDFEKKTSDIIHLSMNSENIPLAKNILNGLIDIYNREWNNDKELVANKTLEYVDSRLEVVKDDLFAADKAIQTFKDKYNLTAIEADVTYYFTQSAEVQVALMEAENQLVLFDLIADFINNPENKYTMIPFSLSTSDPGLTEIITKYNEQLIERNNIFKSGEPNPNLKSFDQRFEAMRLNIQQSMDKVKEGLKISLNTIRKKDKDLNTKLGNIPQIERDYIQLRRNQELHQSVYIFLLEMREQAGAKGISLLPKLKVIDAPYVINKPVSPDLMKIALMVLFFGGIVLPFSFIYGFPYLKKRKNK